jgi:hypothetical protein
MGFDLCKQLFYLDSRRANIMTEKKAAAPVKKMTAEKPAAKKSPQKGDAYKCEVCGLVVSIDETCGCMETCDIICCGKTMQPKKAKAKVKAA